jgi:hypothetical protein
MQLHHAWVRRWLGVGKRTSEMCAHFLTKLLAISFAAVRATGVPMQVQFGINWAYFLTYLWAIIGRTPTIEGVAKRIWPWPNAGISGDHPRNFHTAVGGHRRRNAVGLRHSGRKIAAVYLSGLRLRWMKPAATEIKGRALALLNNGGIDENRC